MLYNMLFKYEYLLWVIFAMVILYAILKEREELGCYRVSIGRQCIDEESVYVKNTKAEHGDTCQNLYERMESVLSYSEKAGVWRRCILLSTIIVIMVYMVYKINNKFNNIQYGVLCLVIFAIIYFYHNYINYHHFRKLKQNGMEILHLITKKCI